MRLLRGTVLDATLLRRTKEQCADALALPPRTVRVRRDAFDVAEADVYESLCMCGERRCWAEGGWRRARADPPFPPPPSS